MQLPLCVLSILLFCLDWQVAKCRLTSLLCTAWCKAWENEVAAWSLWRGEATGKETTSPFHAISMRNRDKKWCHLSLGRVLCKIRQGCKQCLVAKRAPQLHWHHAKHKSNLDAAQQFMAVAITWQKSYRRRDAPKIGQQKRPVSVQLSSFCQSRPSNIFQQCECPRVRGPASVHWISGFRHPLAEAMT